MQHINLYMDKIKLLHIVREYKFYVPVSANFNCIPYYDNTYIYYKYKDVSEEILKFKKVSTIKYSYSPEELLNYISAEHFDAVFFHCIRIQDWKLISKIPKGVIIIWWTWGYELYVKYGMLKPFIPINLYKKYTTEYFQFCKRATPIIKRVAIWAGRYIKSIYFLIYKENALKNIDYICPVTNKEYAILSNNPLLSHVKKFYKPQSIITSEIKYMQAGHILIGNSATPTNNHLDIIIALNKLDLHGRRCIMPLSYGDDNYKAYLKNTLAAVTDLNITYLDSFMPKKEYDELFSNISHAIFGVIRQQAVGNIRMCIAHGIKIFLYKDSILYQELKSIGYKIYSIEDDLSQKELETVLTPEEIEYNSSLLQRRSDYNNAKAIQSASELSSRKFSKHS